MKYTLFLISVLSVIFNSSAQVISDVELMGEWKAVQVSVPNKNEIPEKEAVKFIEDAFLGAKFHFKGNKVFNIGYGKKADQRIKELFQLNNQNWTIENDKIKIGEDKTFSSMEIVYKKYNGITYFLLPMIQIEVVKIKDEQPTTPRDMKSNKDKQLEVKSEVQIVNKEIETDDSEDFKTMLHPPLAPKCKPKWDLERRRLCTRDFINIFIAKKFDTGLGAELNLSGRTTIEVEFIIDNEGKPVNIIATGGPEVLNQHAVEVIAQLPQLTPGSRNGEPVNVSYIQPINFVVQD